jgi:hypothetical protein
MALELVHHRRIRETAALCRKRKTKLRLTVMRSLSFSSLSLGEVKQKWTGITLLTFVDQYTD